MAPAFLRPVQAGAYLRENYGIGSKKALDVLAVRGGGPEFHKAGRARLYTPSALDAYATAGSARLKAQPQKTPARVAATRPYRPRGRPRKVAADAEELTEPA